MEWVEEQTKDFHPSTHLGGKRGLGRSPRARGGHPHKEREDDKRREDWELMVKTEET